jgi:AI-2 transport protein TqsA
LNPAQLSLIDPVVEFPFFVILRFGRMVQPPLTRRGLRHRFFKRMRETVSKLRPPVTLIVILLLIWMLRTAESVLMPLTVAALIVMLVWPLQTRLERWLPRSLSVVVSALALTFAVGLFGLMFWFCGNAVVAKTTVFKQRLNLFISRLDAKLSQHHMLSALSSWNPEHAIGQLMHLAESFVVVTYQVIGVISLVVVLVVLLLIEMHPFCHRLRGRFAAERAERVLGAVSDTSTSIRRFLLMRTITAGTAGVLTGIFTWAIGLDLALVWAVIAYILEYVPVFGSILAVIPPTLVALIEPGRPWLELVTLGGLTVIHFGVGNYLDPLLQGRYLSLPPLMVFYSLVFWGWVWGIPGALLGVPLTVGIVITCQHFESTRWVARLLLNH